MARANDPFRGYLFRFLVGGQEIAGFKSISGLNYEFDIIEYREGGDIITPRKIPGMIKYENIVLERGKGDRYFRDWMRQIFQRSRGLNQNPTNFNFRRDFEIQLRDLDNSVALRWRGYEGWPAKTSHSDFSGTDSELLYETIEITHEGLDEV